jgi:hypothetical protein
VTLEQSKGGPHMSLTHCPRHDMIWGSRSQIELELEINQPPLTHNSQLIAEQGEAIKGFGQQRLCSWRLRLVRTASPKGNPILTVTKYAGAMGRSATSMAGEVRNQPNDEDRPVGATGVAVEPRKWSSLSIELAEIGIRNAWSRQRTDLHEVNSR